MASNSGNKPSFFARYIDQPTPIERPQQVQHAQKVLEWLQRWDRPVVCTREIRIYGPRPRDRKTASNSARILAEQGWLIPNKTRRYDSHAWQIVRKPIVYPTVANRAD